MKSISNENNIQKTLKDSSVFHLSLHNYKGIIHKPKQTLYDKIMSQVEESSFHPDKEICEYLFLQLDENGYFRNDYKTILNGSKFPNEAVKKTLALLRTFTPHGLFSFSLKECLQIQCKLSKEEVSETAFDVCNYLEEIKLQKYSFVMKKCKISQSYLLTTIEFIEKLNKIPAQGYIHHTEVINPTFSILVSNHELSLMKLEKEENLNLPVQEITQAMRIQYRRKPLCLIMIYLCYYQQAHFIHKEKLNYLTLDMISKETKLHTSTISKIIRNETYSFEDKMYALKTLTSTSGTKEANAEVIKQHIINYVQQEDKEKPLSDAMIQQLLQEEHDIHIARRTVVKYREACIIFSSNKRRKR